MKKKSPPGKSPRPGAATPAAKAAAAATGTAGGDAAAADTVSAPKQSMKVPEVLAELETAAKALNVRLTYEAIGGELGAGGLCKVKGQWRVIIDKRTTPSERVSVLAPALARFDFPSLGLSAQVHELLCRVAPTPESRAAEQNAAVASAPGAAAAVITEAATRPSPAGDAGEAESAAAGATLPDDAAVAVP